jgi:hypothetical protein
LVATEPSLASLVLAFAALLPAASARSSLGWRQLRALCLLFPACPPAFDPISLGESNLNVQRGELSKHLDSSERYAFEATSGVTPRWKTATAPMKNSR